jgi:hypothetical protein
MAIRVKAKKGEIFRHFKGTLYEILEIAVHTETNEEMVVYREFDILENPHEGKPWVTSMEMFMSEVDKNKYPDSEYKYRFERNLNRHIRDMSYNKNMEEKNNGRTC